LILTSSVLVTDFLLSSTTYSLSPTNVLVHVGERLFQFTTALPLVQIEFSASLELVSLRRIGDVSPSA